MEPILEEEQAGEHFKWNVTAFPYTRVTGLIGAHWWLEREC
jgi:hypothetical protein